METLPEAVRDFMDNHVVYDNPYGVEIITNSDDSVMVATDWPGEDEEEGINLELFFECDGVDEFIAIFELRSANDLRRITPAFMMLLFEQGKLDVCCAVDSQRNYYSLQFRKINNIMMAKDDHDVSHEVLAILETAQQFKDYTQHRYLLAKPPPQDPLGLA